MSSLPWPSFWEHIPEADRGTLSEILTELLGTGVLLGTEGRGRTQYQLARDYRLELTEYLAPLHLELVEDLEHSILQARPVPGDCGLTAKFNKAETLVVLILWRIYDDTRLQQITPTILTTAADLFEKWRTFFEKIEPPSEQQLERILAKLRRQRLIRMQPRSEVERFADLRIEILPTLPQVIPFEDTGAWQHQAGIYTDASTDNPSSEEPASDEASETNEPPEERE